MYGGYFGAAQGILLLAILNLSLDDDLHRLDALELVLARIVNLVAGVPFVFVAQIAWLPAALTAGGSVLGGVLGARYGRRLPASVLRAVILTSGSWPSCVGWPQAAGALSGRYWARTSDLLLVRQALYQLS